MQLQTSAADRYKISRRFSAALRSFSEKEIANLQGILDTRDFQQFLSRVLNPDRRKTITLEVDSGGQPIGWQRSRDGDMTK